MKKNMDKCKENSDKCKDICEWIYNEDSEELEYTFQGFPCPYQSWMKDDYYRDDCLNKYSELECTPPTSKTSCSWTSNNICMPTDYKDTYIGIYNTESKTSDMQKNVKPIIKNFIKDKESINSLFTEIPMNRLYNPKIDFDQLEDDILYEKNNISSTPYIKDRDNELLDNLNEDYIKNICANGGCIDINTDEGINKLHNKLYYKLPKNHKFKRILNNIEYILEIKGYSQFRPLFNEIRNNTYKYKNNLKEYLEENMKNILLEDEIILFLDKLPFDDINNEGIQSNIKDLQGNNLYPKMYKSLLTELQTNTKFRQCIDEKLGIHLHKDYKKFKIDVEKKNFKIGKYIDFIKSACDEFISLPPDKIRECIDKLNYSEVLKNNICEGDITLTMIDSYNLVLEFIGIHINFNELDEGTIIRLTPLIKEVLHKVITTSQYYEQTLCKGKTSKITQNLKTMYNSLFDTRKSIEYPFKNHIKWKWFKPFDNIFGKVILLIFICFIFAKIVDLFSGKDCCPQVPVNK